MPNTRISKEHSLQVMSLLICKPWLDNSEVCGALPGEVVRRYPDDLERHVDWRRKVIYAVIRILTDSTVGEPLSSDAPWWQWFKVTWLIVNRPDLRNKKRAVAGVEAAPYRSWDDVGYAPLANAVFKKLQPDGPDRERVVGNMEKMARHLSPRALQRTPLQPNASALAPCGPAI